MKQQKNMRLTNSTIEQLDTLCRWMGGTQTDILAQAVNDLYEQERIKRMNAIDALTDTVARAVARLQTPGIEGWGLTLLDGAAFEKVVASPAYGCTNETCNHNSHDPADSDYKLIPTAGVLIDLGGQLEYDEVYVRWFALVRDDGVRYLQQSSPRHYHSGVRYVEQANVPEWALASLAKA